MTETNNNLLIDQSAPYMRLTAAISALVLLLIFAFLFISTEYQRVRRSNALHAAVFRGDAARVEELLNSGAPVDQINEDRVFGVRIRSYPYAYENGVTPLYVAVCRNNLKLVKLLVKRGANVNHSVDSPYTILQRG
jgi:ankyrin repeat protein